MTIHLPGRAAPAPEISSELARILADQAEREAAVLALYAPKQGGVVRLALQLQLHWNSESIAYHGSDEVTDVWFVDREHA